MKVNEIRKLDDNDVTKELNRRQLEMVGFRFSKTAGTLKDNNEIKKLRRIIAKIKTVIREREIIKENG